MPSDSVWTHPPSHSLNIMRSRNSIIFWRGQRLFMSCSPWPISSNSIKRLMLRLVQHNWIFFLNSLPTFHTNCPDGSHFTYTLLESYLATTQPGINFWCKIVILRLLKLNIRARQDIQEIFAVTAWRAAIWPWVTGQNMTVGITIYGLGKPAVDWAKYPKSGQDQHQAGFEL